MSHRTNTGDLRALIVELQRRIEVLERNRVVPDGFTIEVRNGCPHFVNTDTGRACCSCIPETSDVTATGFEAANIVPAGTPAPSDTVVAAQPFPPGVSGLSIEAVSSNQAATLSNPGAFLYGQLESMIAAYTVGTVIPADYTVVFSGGGAYYTHAAHVIHGVTAVRAAVSNLPAAGFGPFSFPQVTATAPGQLVVYLLHSGTDTLAGNVTIAPTPTSLWDSGALTAQGDLDGWYEVTVDQGLVEQRTVTLDTSRRVRLTTLLCDYTSPA